MKSPRLQADGDDVGPVEEILRGGLVNRGDDEEHDVLVVDMCREKLRPKNPLDADSNKLLRFEEDELLGSGGLLGRRK